MPNPIPSDRSIARLITAVDVLILCLFLLATAVAIDGGRRFWIGPWRVSVRDPVRLYCGAAVFAVVRLIVWRRMRPLPSLIGWRRARSSRRTFSDSGQRTSADARPLPRSAIAAAGTGAWQGGAQAWLRLAAVSAVVVAQPMLDAIARSPEFLIAHESTPMDIVITVVGLVVLVPSVLVGPVLLARLIGWRAQLAAESAVVGALFTLLAMQVAKHLGGTDARLALPLALVTGVFVALVYHRAPVLRSMATVAAISLLLVPALFFLAPAMRRVMFPPHGTADRRPHVSAAAALKGTAVPVVLLIFDETPLVSLLGAHGAIDARHYPSFAGLARDGTLFRNATTVSDYTQWAVPAILTGRYPRGRDTPSDDDGASIYTLLGDTYRFEVSEVATDLCPADLCPPAIPPVTTRLALLANDLGYVYLHALSTADLAARLPSLTNDWRNFGYLGAWRRRGAEEQRQRRPGVMNRLVAEAFLERIRADGGRPEFFLLHTLLPHFPHLQLPSGQFNATRADVPAFATGETWNDDETAVAQLHQRHLLQLRYIDSFLGQLLERLKANDRYRRALVIVTSDHGISFEPGTARRQFSEPAAAEIMRVPLLIKLPEGVPVPPAHDIEGQHVSDRNAQTIDILPTVADVLEIALPWPVDGVSLVDPARAEPRSKQMFFDSATRSRTFDSRGPDVAAALARKLRTFDVPGNDHFSPRPDRFEELLGRPLSELRVQPGGGIVHVDRLSAFLDYRPAAEDLAFEVAGRFEPTSPAEAHPTYVAVAVNGIVRAVTRTWKGRPEGWRVAPSPAVWQPGRNAVEVFAVEADDAGPFLKRSEIGARDTAPPAAR